MLFSWSFVLSRDNRRKRRKRGNNEAGKFDKPKAVCYGTASRVYYGTASRVCYGTVSRVCYGTASRVCYGTASRVFHGTVRKTVQKIDNSCILLTDYSRGQ